MTFSCQYASHSSSGTSSKRACRASPTLLTRTSRPPSAATASPTARSGAPAGARSSDRCADSPTPGAALRPQVTTRAPSATSRRPSPGRCRRSSRSRDSACRRVRGPRARLAYPRDDDDRPGQARRDRLEPGAPLSRVTRTRRSTRQGVGSHASSQSCARRAGSAIYTSPLRRASETARIVAGRLGLPAQELEALREIDVGEWQGLTVAEVRKRFPERRTSPGTPAGRRGRHTTSSQPAWSRRCSSSADATPGSACSGSRTQARSALP